MKNATKIKIIIGLALLILLLVFIHKTRSFEIKSEVGIGPTTRYSENARTLELPIYPNCPAAGTITGPVPDNLHYPGCPTELPITAYSELDSCHYPGCPMANGKKASIGYVACPRDWKLGTKIEVEGLGTFECGDRYRKDLSDRIDVFMGYGKEAHQKAIEFGKQIKQVEIIITFKN